MIGSGFGGSVASLRLAQAGVPVLLLERGKWWPTGPNADTFPHSGEWDERVFFYTVPPALRDVVSSQPYVGMLEPIFGQNMIAVVAAAVGGGSLAYQGMTLQPSEEDFTAWFPAGLDYGELNATYYPRVAQMLQIATAPDALINSPTYFPSRVFARNAQNVGYEVAKVPMPVDWSYALDELKGEMAPSYTDGDCALGVNNGGKHSLDTNYIPQGMATGFLTVAPQHNVTDIARTSDGSWEVYANQTDESGAVLQQKIITTRALIVTAGTMNTAKLTLRAQAHGTIPDLPESLGQGYGTNGDQIYFWSDFAEDLGTPEGSPIIYASFEWDSGSAPSNTLIQSALPPIRDRAKALAALIPGAVGVAGPYIDLHSTMLIGYGISASRGQFVWNSQTGEAELHWPSNGDAELNQRIHERVSAVAGKESLLINLSGVVKNTWHSVGGAAIGEVCDLEGRVNGQQGLYILDGALMPGTTCACNPSMTIAAIAERALDRIVRTDVGTVF